MSKADDLLDATVRHQIGILRLSNATSAKMLALLARVEADVLAQLRALDMDGITARRLDRQLEAVRLLYRQEYDRLNGILQADLDDLADYEAGFAARQLRATVGGAFDRPTRAVVVAAVNARPFQGRFLSEWMAGLGEDNGRRVRDAMRIGFVEGESLQQLIARIRGTRANGYRDGILEINRRAAERIVRTSINHTAARAREEAFRSSPLISAVQWVSVLDSRTSVVCAGRDGETYQIDSGPRPPAHFNCRSQITAVLDGFPPAERVTYEQWLKRQPTSVQNEVLGPSRAELWRNGDVPLDRFVDRKGEMWTLDELRRREKVDI